MNTFFKCNRRQTTSVINVETLRPTKIIVRAIDQSKPNAVYTNRYKTVNGKATFKIMLPQSPELLLIQVYNSANGNLPTGRDNTFRVSFGEERLQKTLTCFTGNNKVANFVKFAQEFSENAGILSAGQNGQSVYRSDDGKFQIVYVDNIIDTNTIIPAGRNGEFIPNPNYGRILRTPARINQDKGIIEIAKVQFIRYTIPMRMAILLHEFSHFYINRNPKNEIEADLNALLIYLGMGYPRIEGHNAFTEVFKNSPTNQNGDRERKITHFINNFDSYGFSKC